MDRKEVSKLKESIYQKEYRGNTSRNLFNSAWRQYVGWLRGSIDDPHDELDITNWLDQIISEKVNNPKSKYYIYG